MAFWVGFATVSFFFSFFFLLMYVRLSLDDGVRSFNLFTLRCCRGLWGMTRRGGFFLFRFLVVECITIIILFYFNYLFVYSLIRVCLSW